MGSARALHQDFLSKKNFAFLSCKYIIAVGNVVCLSRTHEIILRFRNTSQFLCWNPLWPLISEALELMEMTSHTTPLQLHLCEHQRKLMPFISHSFVSLSSKGSHRLTKIHTSSSPPRPSSDTSIDLHRWKMEIWGAHSCIFIPLKEKSSFVLFFL